MKTENKIWLKYTTLAILLFAVAFSGCEKDNDPKAPDLPPIGTFVMDFNDFIGSKSVSGAEDAKGPATANWGWAASNVLVWNTVLTINLIVPVASFYEAFDHKGIYEGDNEWSWTYNFMAGGVSHKAELHGTLTETQVLWEMYISKENVFTDFPWYSGSHNILRTEGQWVLNGSPEAPAAYLQIDWTRGENDNSADIKYMNIVAGSNYYESYIEYGRTNEVPLDLFYDIYDSSIQNLVEIEWSESTKEGRVKDAEHFYDMLWHCWDNVLQDTDCN